MKPQDEEVKKKVLTGTSVLCVCVFYIKLHLYNKKGLLMENALKDKG